MAAETKYDGNTVYIGFNEMPSDLRVMINAWALQANTALGSGVHVWALHNAPEGWRPGDREVQGYNVTARHGEIR